MKKFLLAILMTSQALLTGCAASIQPITTPDNKKGFFVSCNGGTETWASCYSNSTQACGGKYKVIDKSDTSTPTAHGPIVNRSLIIECQQ
jgi:hypothetical protein